jgi:hypothetical protein
MVISPFGLGISFLVVDQCAVEAGGLIATIAHPIIVPLVGVDTLRLNVGHPVKGRRRCGLNLDGSDVFLCKRCRLIRNPGPSSSLGSFLLSSTSMSSFEDRVSVASLFFDGLSMANKMRSDANIRSEVVVDEKKTSLFEEHVIRLLLRSISRQLIFPAYTGVTLPLADQLSSSQQTGRDPIGPGESIETGPQCIFCLFSLSIMWYTRIGFSADQDLDRNI